MHHIMLSYPLFGTGMQILEQETDLFVSNDGQIAPYLPQLQQADAFITRNVHPTTEQLAQCPKLKIIGIPGVGYQSYDLDFLNDRGILLVYCPGTNLRSVAEHAVAMAYTLSKQLLQDDRQVRAGNYQIRNSFGHMELAGSPVGIVGFGQIGRETARLFCRNDLQVHVFDPFADRKEVEALGYLSHETLHGLLGQVRLVSLHMPSLPSTRHLLDREAFHAMCDGVLFINCARGSVVDEAALYDALSDGKVAAAALDVMEAEPFSLESPLLQHPNVLVTPHVAGVTQQAAARTHELVVRSTLSLLDGHLAGHIANPEALRHAKWSHLALRP